MLDFCSQHGFACDIEVIPIQKVNEAYERVVKATSLSLRDRHELAGEGLRSTENCVASDAFVRGCAKRNEVAVVVTVE